MSTPRPRWDLACFSYLAHAQVLHVTRYPDADQGTEVGWTFPSLAGDGPLVARACAQRGLHTVLVANQTGQDLTGQQIRQTLETAGVHHRPGPGPAPDHTPHLTVVTDDAGTRTWFADLTDAHTSLHLADTTPLSTARLAYIDGYTVIADAAANALRATTAGGTPVLLNLGGDPLHPRLRAAAGHAHLYAVQTSLPEPRSHEAEHLARTLMAELRPYGAVVTLGALGAYALTRTSWHRVTAAKTDVTHTHGAGAAFSAALAAAHLDGHDLPAALHHACAAGTAHCTTVPDLTVPGRTTS
ncbi:PfkB family carbohydrate kinase [Streptomyces sp. NPDC004539]|uniref:carbohydrate kinase family protein n=1 Tax=Streptomyces sp. NPDC004539 TaxID=3154280 RepID=UPI0033AB4543